MQISVHGTAFTSYDVKANKQTKEEIAKEKISFDETIKQTNAVENVVYHTTTQADDAKPTTFIDPVTKKYVIASLKNETLDKLRGHFGTDNVVEKKDGTIRLTGDAEAFVSGWFADIAYKRDFLTADKNSDGQLSKDEYNNTRNNFGIEGFAITESSSGSEKLLVAGEKIMEDNTYGYSDNTQAGYYRNYQKFDTVDSLDDELNTTLQVDKDFNGKMSLEEAYSAKGNTVEETVFKDLEMWGITTVPSDLDTSDFDFLLNFVLDIFFQKDGKEQEKIMSKVNEMLNSMEEITSDDIEKVYTEEHLEHIQALKENNNATLDAYTRNTKPNPINM